MRIRTLIINTFSLVFTLVRAQSPAEDYTDSLFKELKAFDKASTVIKTSLQSIKWQQIDTFTIQHYNCAIRGNGPQLDTLTIELRVEEDWSDEKIKATKERNSVLITELSSIYLRHMDSIQWRGYKITSASFDSNKVSFLKRQYPVKFSTEDQKKIDQITRCPDFIHNGLGIFLDCNNPGIQEIEVKAKYHSKLRFISQDLFETEQVNFGSKHVYE